MLELLIAFIGGGALAAIIKGVFDVVKIRLEQRRAFPETIKKMRKIYTLMDNLKADVGCDRVLILSAKNGGGIPRPGGHLYVSVLFETFDSDFVSVAEWWQNRRVDEQYVNMLCGLEEDKEGIIKLTTDKMKKSMLKDTYETEGVEASVVAKIKETGDRYYFISCNFKDGRKIDLPTRVSVANHVAKIKELL